MSKKIILLFLISCIMSISIATAYSMPPAYVSSVEILNEIDLEIEVGECISLTATAVPVGLNYVYMKWDADNSDIISISTTSPEEKLEPPVSTAEITAIAEGTVTITVYADYDLSYPLTSDSVTIKIVDSSKAVNEKSYPYMINELSLKSVAGNCINTILANQSFIVDITVVKEQEREAKDYVFVVTYDTDGALLSLDYVKAKFPLNIECSFGFNVPTQEKQVGSIKAYVWNSFTAPEPLAESKTLTFE